MTFVVSGCTAGNTSITPTLTYVAGDIISVSTSEALASF
jgi:hypothetical protein